MIEEEGISAEKWEEWEPDAFQAGYRKGIGERKNSAADRDIAIARAVRDWIIAPRQTSGEAYRYWLSVHLDDDALARIIRTAIAEGKVEP